MANVLLISKGTYGDIVPFLSLGAALKKRGNRLTLLTHCHYKSVAEKVGLEFDSYDTPDQYDCFIKDGVLLEQPGGIREFADKHAFPQFSAEVAMIQRHCYEDNTVLVTRHMAGLAAQCIAEKDHIPLISVFTAVAQMECMFVLEQLYQGPLASKTNACRASIGLPPVKDWAQWTRGSDCALVCWPPSFAAPSPAWPKQVVFLGFLRSDLAETGPLSATLEQAISEAGKLVLVTGGTAVSARANEFYRVAMEACFLAGLTGILVCPHRELVPIGLLPGTMYFSQLPFASLMPRVSVVVHHGGTSILVRALAAGVPQIALPFGADRHDTALRLQRLGVCTCIPVPQWRPEHLASHLKDALHSLSIAESCAKMRLQIDTSGDLERGCRTIEMLANGTA